MPLLLVGRTCLRPAGVIALLCLTALAPARATAQGVTAGIIGQVKDESGAVLPGLTVTVKSPALQVPEVSVVTDERGEYRLTALPIGVYSVDYMLSGFQNVRVDGVRLTVGFVAKLDQVVKVGSLAETVTVSGASPIVDVTSGAAGTTLTGEAVALIPSGANGLQSYLAQVPAARQNFDVGGSNATDTNLFIANGQSSEAWQILEGVLAAALTPAANGTHYDYNAVDEARVQAIGNNSEVPRRGMAIDVVMKSGGNDFHGGAQWAQTHDALQSNNISEELSSQGVVGTPKLEARWDGDVQIGGKLIENRLWFYESFRKRAIDYDYPFLFNPDGSPVLHPQNQKFWVNKGSGQVTRNTKLIAFWHQVWDYEKRGATQFVPPQSMTSSTGRFTTGKVEWQAVRGNWLTLSAQYGQFFWTSTTAGFDPGVPLQMDIATLKVDGDGYDGAVGGNKLKHGKVVATMYRPDLFFGNHEFKIGYDQIFGESITHRPPRRSGDYQLLFSNGVPFEVNVFNSPGDPTQHSMYVGLYAQDKWTLARRLTLNLGLRGAHDNAYVPPQCQLAGPFQTAFPTNCSGEIQPNMFKTLSPRVHVAFDVLGDGKSVIKGGYGHFVHMRLNGGYELAHLNPNGAKTYTYLWHDLNGNRDYNPGEVNLNPNGPDFISNNGLTAGIVNPDEVPPTEDEFSIGFERQLAGDLAVRVSGMYAHNKHVPRYLNPSLPYSAYTIPIVNRLPGDDGVVNTADDPGGTITYYDYPASLRGLVNQTIQLVNDDSKNDTTFKTIEIAGTKRLSHNWQFSASYSTTKKHIPYGDSSGVTLAGGAANPLPLNPNAEIFVADDTWAWISKFTGSYLFPWDVLGSFGYTSRSGDVFAPQALFRGGTQIPSIVLNVAPIGTIALPAINQLDIRGAKEFRLGGSRRLGLRVDCFNCLNASTITAVVTRQGPNYLDSTAAASQSALTGFMLPRILQLEAHFSF